jgi:hypothetical protein
MIIPDFIFEGTGRKALKGHDISTRCSAPGINKK